MKRILLADLHRTLFETEARAAFPRECCGLIVGRRDRTTFHVERLHPTRNLASEADRFEIDPAEHLRLLRTLRADRQFVLGCYHSHPNGNAKPSRRDLEGAAEAGFVWLIGALSSETGRVSLAGFEYCGGAFAPLLVECERAIASVGGTSASQ